MERFTVKERVCRWQVEDDEPHVRVFIDKVKVYHRVVVINGRKKTEGAFVHRLPQWMAEERVRLDRSDLATEGKDPEIVSVRDHDSELFDVKVDGNKGFDEKCDALNAFLPLDSFVLSYDVFYSEIGGYFVESLIGDACKVCTGDFLCRLDDFGPYDRSDEDEDNKDDCCCKTQVSRIGHSVL